MGKKSKPNHSADDVEIERIESEMIDERSGPPQYELLTYPADYTLEVLYSKWQNGDIRIPKLQRLFVWKQPQASKLIESFLLGLPVPGVFLYAERKKETLLVVDGHQRLKSIFYFFEGFFGEEKAGRRPVFRLKLGDGSRWNGKTWRDLSEVDARRLKNSVLRAFIIKQLSPKDNTSIYHVFERLNTGGTQLNGQELRNCIMEGAFNDLLIELNKSSAWRKILGKKVLDQRMKDGELILRGLSLYYDSQEYSKPMKDFMSGFMRTNRNGERNEEFKKLFSKVASAVLEALGEKPFHIRAGLSAPVFDAVFVAFARNKGQGLEDVRPRYERLLKDEEFQKLTGKATTDVDSVKKRMGIADKILFP